MEEKIIKENKSEETTSLADVNTVHFSVVIPAFNEADKITNTLTQVTNFMEIYEPNYEVIVVNDGSKDATAKLVAEYVLENSRVRLFDNPHKGKGPTVWAGVMGAKGQYIYLADADLSAPMAELKKLFMWVNEHGYDIVIASREGTGARRLNEPAYRHLMGRIFNFLVQFVALPGIKDSQCGFKLFKRDVARKIFNMLRVYGPSAKEIDKAYFGAFDVEVLYLARKLGYKIKEVPVLWQYVKTTRLNPISDSLKMAKDVFQVRINYMRGLYASSDPISK